MNDDDLIPKDRARVEGVGGGGGGDGGEGEWC